MAVVEEADSDFEGGECLQSLGIQVVEPQVAIDRAVAWFGRRRQVGVTRKDEGEFTLQAIQCERRQRLRVLRPLLDSCQLLVGAHRFRLRERRSDAFRAKARR
jgi:hypothetical protein